MGNGVWNEWQRYGMECPAGDCDTKAAILYQTPKKLIMNLNNFTPHCISQNALKILMLSVVFSIAQMQRGKSPGFPQICFLFFCFLKFSPQLSPLGLSRSLKNL